MRPFPSNQISGMVRPVLILTMLLAPLPALAQYRGRDDDSRDDRSRREWRSDDRDSDRRSWGRDSSGNDDESDENRDSRFGRRDDGRSDDSDHRERGRPSPADFFDRLDANGNGRLDGDEMPEGRFGSYLDRAGIEEGASREDFSAGFERLRAERESGSDDENRDRSDNHDQPRSTTGFTPAPRERVTQNLPAAFLDRDTNGDDQIALHEWRAWNWTRLDEFLFLDANADGFVTPREIAILTGETSEGDANSANSRRESRATSTPLDENNPHVKRGREIFEILDTDHDGTASVAELSRLNKLRPMFERADIPLDQEMTANEFTANYYRAAQ